MSKLTILFIILSFLILFPQPAKAATISPIGDLNPGQIKTFTIDDLDLDSPYIVIVSKLVHKNILWNTETYGDLTTNCFNSDSNGQIAGKAGPYLQPGYYRITISKTNPGDCMPSGEIIVSQDFSVGEPTRQDCCPKFSLYKNRSFYSRNGDVCKHSPFDVPLTVNYSSPTICSQQKTYCEPQSLMCFKSKTFSTGKICIDPTDLDFENKKKDTNKYAVCGSAGGKIAPGCTDDPTNPGIATAIGCIHTNPAELAKDLLKFIIGIGGGLAFLMMLLGAFQMLTSQGNPETLNAGRERLTSAVVGLLFIIFAVLFLQIIGAGILDIPGFKP